MNAAPRVESTIDYDGRYWRWTVTVIRGGWLSMDGDSRHGRARSESLARRQMDRATARAVAVLEAERERRATRESTIVEAEL